MAPLTAISDFCSNKYIITNGHLLLIQFKLVHNNNKIVENSQTGIKYYNCVYASTSI